MLNKAVFLDRDGVINHDPDDYTYRLHETTILPGIIEFAQKVKEKGYLIIVITNQGGISKSRYSHAHVDAVNDFIQTEFKNHYKLGRISLLVIIFVCFIVISNAVSSTFCYNLGLNATI